MTLTLQAIGVVLLGCTAIVVCCAALAPLFDENELPIDEVQDDPRPGEVLRAAWADRETQEPISPITGKPITIRNHADLSAAVAARHRLGDVARIGWQTRRAGK